MFIYTTTAQSFDGKMSALCSPALFNWKMRLFLPYLQPHLLWNALLRKSLSMKLESVTMKENVERSNSLPIMLTSWCHVSLHHISGQPLLPAWHWWHYCVKSVLWIMMAGAVTVKWLLTTMGYYRDIVKAAAAGRKDEVDGDTVAP